MQLEFFYESRAIFGFLKIINTDYIFVKAQEEINIMRDYFFQYLNCSPVCCLHELRFYYLHKQQIENMLHPHNK